MMNTLPQLAGGFELNHMGRVTPANRETIAECFASAWQQVGVDGEKIQACYRGMMVWLEDCLIQGVACTGNPHQGHNYFMRLTSPVIFDMPGGNTWLTLVIGEELAHAFLFATRDPTHVPKLQGHEEAAQEVMERWGFDMAEHQKQFDWVISHCKNGIWGKLPWK